MSESPSVPQTVLTKFLTEVEAFPPARESPHPQMLLMSLSKALGGGATSYFCQNANRSGELYMEAIVTFRDRVAIVSIGASWNIEWIPPRAITRVHLADELILPGARVVSMHIEQNDRKRLTWREAVKINSSSKLYDVARRVASFTRGVVDPQ